MMEKTKVIPLIEDLNQTKLFYEDLVSFMVMKNDPKWSFESWTSNLEKLLGLPSEELKNQGFLDFVNPEDKEIFMKNFQKARRSNQDGLFFDKLRLVKPDGSYVWTDIRLTFLKDLDGKLSHFFGYLLNITEPLEEKRLLETLTDIVPVGIFLHEYGRIIYMNERSLSISGYTANELRKIGNIINLVYPEDRKFVEKIIQMRKNGEDGTLNYKIRIVTKDEKVKWVKIISKVLTYKGKKLSVGIVQDIDKIIQLEFAKELLSKINKSMITITDKYSLLQNICKIFGSYDSFREIAIYKVSKQGLNLECSAHKSELILQLQQDRMLEEKLPNLKKPVYISDLNKLKGYDHYVEVLRKNRVNSIILLPIKHRRKIEYILSLYIKEKNYFSIEVLEIFNEITKDISFMFDYIKQQESIFQKEFFDPLTGIGNRNYLINNLEKYIKKKRTFYFLLVDIRNFKHINETYGKDTGDKILKTLARKLDKKLTYENVFRGSNDEFFIISSSEDIYKTIENIKSILQNIKINKEIFSLDYNIGIVKYPENGSKADELILKLERTLELAKRAGKNEIMFFDEEKYKGLRRTFIIEKKLDRAIKNKDFILFFQPIVSIEDNRIQSAEVLIRWKDEDGNIILPNEFIHIAEKTGQIKEIDKIVLLDVKNLLKKWNTLFSPKDSPEKKEKDTSFYLSINITPSNVDNIIQILKNRKLFSKDDLDLMKKYVTIELTERTSIDIYKAGEKIEKLKKLGFKIAIDDFGTGYSSLSYLAELNVDYLKIDMSFIQRMLEEENIYKLVRSIINIAKIFDIKVVAEGVENESQLEELKKLGCDLYQGFLFSKPLPQEELEQILKNENLVL